MSLHQPVSDMFREKKVCVLVPTYNNGGTLSIVLGSLLPYTEQIIVVNDGSTDNTLSILSEFKNLEIVSYAKNQGKGFALRKGFAQAVASGYDYAITIDSDGQHFADDLPNFLSRLNEFPNAIIIGTRNMEQASVPGKSSFGNKFSNFWFWVNTGIYRNDTQSGYRLYPVRALKDIRFVTWKFEFEIEVIVRGAWSGIDVVEVPVKVFYPEKGKRISHFRPFTDFTRIVLLNTLFVLTAVFYIKPRDLFLSLKKKTSVKSFVTSSSTSRSRTLEKQSQ